MNYDSQKIIPVDIQKEMKKSYIDYAMSVIVGRALPDVRDGLKPVHRRILYTMYEDNLTSERPFRKSATTVGAVLGRYHPHGDAAVYDSLVRMAQDFSLRYPMIDGHGNFGSIDGDSAAAYRYTEARMAKISEQMLADIEKETVNFIPNFDDQGKEPTVLPTRVPTLLVNGSVGIAVGMATNIPPHNLNETVNALLEIIDNPEATLDDIMVHLKGPDFPTGGIILGRAGIREAYYTGRGRVTVRARTQIEEFKDSRFRILVTEIPYQVNKARLIESIAELVKQKRIEGISDLRDESDRNGMKIVIELKRDVNAQVILNQLFKHSQLQDNFSVNMLALVNNQPQTLNIRQILDQFIDFRKDIVVRRTKFDLKKAQERAHILEGLKKAQDNIDEVISIIRANKDIPSAKAALIERFLFSDVQAQAIVDMRLGRLAGLERAKIEKELDDLLKLIDYYNDVLSNESMVYDIIKTELNEIKEKFGDERRTEISALEDEIDIEDLIEEEDCVFTLTHYGYIKRMPVSTYKSQRRGGRGISGMTTREEDFVETIFVSSTHSYVLFFSSTGKMYKKKGYEIPESGRTAKGTNIINLLQIEQDEKITAMIKVPDLSAGFMTMVTKQGIIKKTQLKELDSARKGGLIAINLDEGDELISANHTDGSKDIVVATRLGKAIRFFEQDVRAMGRNARGVKAIELSPSDYVIGVALAQDDADLLTVTENGYGKKTPLSEYKTQNRGGKGILNYNITPKTGEIVGITVVKEQDGDDIMLISSDGVIIRFSSNNVSRFGRVASGVILMRVSSDIKVVNMAKVAKEEEEAADETSEKDKEPGQDKEQ